MLRFVDPGATAHDDERGDLTAQIQVTGEVDTATLGTYTLTYSVSNGLLTTTITRTVRVVDTQPPVMTPAVAWPPLLFPANHQMVDVTVLYLAAEACDPQVSCTHHGDEQRAGERHRTRRSRAGLADSRRQPHPAARRALEPGVGRLYTITVTCVDDSGNARVRTTAVLVPRPGKLALSRGANTICKLSGLRLIVTERVRTGAGVGLGGRSGAPSPQPPAPSTVKERGHGFKTSNTRGLRGGRSAFGPDSRPAARDSRLAAVARSESGWVGAVLSRAEGLAGAADAEVEGRTRARATPPRC